MGIKTIQESINDLLFQFAYMLNLRFDPKSRAVQEIAEALDDKHTDVLKNSEANARASKHIARSVPEINKKLLKLSVKALDNLKLDKQTYNDAHEMIIQTEKAIKDI